MAAIGKQRKSEGSRIPPFVPSPAAPHTPGWLVNGHNDDLDHDDDLDDHADLGDDHDLDDHADVQDIAN